MHWPLLTICIKGWPLFSSFAVLVQIHLKIWVIKRKLLDFLTIVIDGNVLLERENSGPSELHFLDILLKKKNFKII